MVSSEFVSRSGSYCSSGSDEEVATGDSDAGVELHDTSGEGVVVPSEDSELHCSWLAGVSAMSWDCPRLLRLPRRLRVLLPTTASSLWGVCEEVGFSDIVGLKVWASE